MLEGDAGASEKRPRDSSDEDHGDLPGDAKKVRSSAVVMPSGNPLGIVCQFPHFGDICPEHVVPGIEALLAQGYETLETLELRAQKELDAGTLTCNSLAEEFEAISDPVARAWNVVQHLKAVADSEELRDAVDEVESQVTEYNLRLGQSVTMYRAWKFLQAKAPCILSPSQERLVAINLRDAQLAGVALDGEAKERFNAIQVRLAELETKFGNNVLDATKAFAVRLTDKTEVSGIPRSVLELAAQTAQEKALKPEDVEASWESGPWVFTLDDPTYEPVLRYADDRELRHTMQKSYMTRASDLEQLTTDADEEAKAQFAEKPRDNEPVMKEMLELRRESAVLLGYPHYTAFSLASKMADAESLEKLQSELLSAAKQQAQRELRELQEFAWKIGFSKNQDLKSWDVAYYATKLKEQTFGFTEEELKPYFSLERVQSGLWTLARELFDVEVRRVEAPENLGVSFWHDDVQFFGVWSDSGGDLLAYFYFDPYVRKDTKEGGAWQDPLTNRTANPRLVDAESNIRLPVGHIVCNQSPPTRERPSLMDLEDVITLFHEFGHFLQHALTEEKEGLVAGHSGIEWDAIELPSQFMENWVYHRPTFDKMAVHYETGERMSEELYEKISRARTFRAGSQMLAYLHSSMIDLQLHGDYVASGLQSATVYEVEQKLSETTRLMPRNSWDRTLNAFSHAFGSSDYAAGYWSYIWAEVLSADCFAAFEEAGINNVEELKRIGQKFRKTVLGSGGGVPPGEVFRRFRGRDPTPDALLRHKGLVPM